MENILYNISQVLGITIIHSLWQGLLIYFLLRVVLLCAPGLSSSTKYLMAVSSLLGITGWFAYTLIHEIQLYDWLAKPADLVNMPLLAGFPQNIQQFGNQTIRYYYSIEEYLPYVTAIYMIGLLLNMARVVLAHRKIQTIKRTMSLGVQLQQQISAFAKKLDITKTVKVGFSHMVDVPCIVGFFKPVILLPFTLSTYLGSDEIEAILMHELAHIKRNDYIINLLQQVITTLLFFNPCVLLINKIIGEERENSCDDLVVDATQNPVMYAKALFKLEQRRQNELQLALAVTGKKYHLLNRIERIMKTKKQTSSVRPTLVALLILTLSVGSLALFNPQIAQGKISVKSIVPAIKNMLADTIPAKKAIKANKALKAKTKAELAATEAQKIKALKQKAENRELYSYDNDNDNGNNNDNDNNDNRSYNYYNNGIKDAELDRLGKQVSKHGDAISKYYDSPAFKAKSEELDKLGKQIDAFYNSPEIKQATAAQEKAAADYEKLWGGRSTDMEKTGKQMEALGKQIENYFNAPEFKALNEKLRKKYGISKDGYSDSRDENYKKYQAELDENLSPQIKEQTAQMRKLGDQMRGMSHSPDAVKQRDAMREAGEAMRKAYNNPDIKATQERMRKIGQDMRVYTSNPEIKKEQEALRDASAKLRAYTKSPEFKKKVAEYRKTHPGNTYYWENDDAKNYVEKPQAPEKPEAPESPATSESN